MPFVQSCQVILKEKKASEGTDAADGAAADKVCLAHPHRSLQYSTNHPFTHVLTRSLAHLCLRACVRVCVCVATPDPVG
jgi:hypothetical protein